MNRVLGQSLYKKNILHRLVALLLMASLLIVVPGCQKKKPEIIDGKDIIPLPSKAVTEAPTNANNEIVLKGIFTGKDSDNKKMKFVSPFTFVSSVMNIRSYFKTHS